MGGQDMTRGRRNAFRGTFTRATFHARFVDDSRVSFHAEDISRFADVSRQAVTFSVRRHLAACVRDAYS